MTLRTLLLGRLLPTFIGLASLAMVMGLDLEFNPRVLRRFHILPLIGIFLIWCPDSTLLGDKLSDPIIERGIRLLGWLLLLVHVIGVLLILRSTAVAGAY